MSNKATRHSATDNSPLTVEDLLQILKQIPVKDRKTKIHMLSDQEGNRITGLWSVEVGDDGVISLIPHHRNV